jgi:glycosyltransferase involved in cell wall biosynthesis
VKTYRIAIFHNLISGGAKRSVYEYTKALTRRGHEIDLFTLNTRENEFLSVSEFVGNITQSDFSPIISLGDHTFLISPLRSLELKRLEKVSREIAREIDQRKYDVALVHNSRFIQCPMVMQYIQKTPKVYYCHETFRFLTEEHPHLDTVRDRMRSMVHTLLRSYMNQLSSLERENLREADLTLTNSYFTRDNLFRAYQVSSEVCYQGVDIDKFRPIETERENSVLCVGQLSRWKAQDFLIDSLSKLPLKIRPKLILVYDKGNKSYIQFLKKMADREHVGLSLKQRINDEELVHLYNTSKAFVYAPIREPFGFVPLEAMACGTPVIAVLEGGVKEVVRRESGCSGVSRDPDEFAKTLKEILVSEERWTERAKKCRNYVVSQWTWEKAAERFEEKINNLLSNS